MPTKKTTKPKAPKIRPLLGWREWVNLPDWNATLIKAKIDTGARTSALHVEDVEEFIKGGEVYVRFVIPRSREHEPVEAEARLVDQRPVKSSSGEEEHRHVVSTTIEIGERQFQAEITLTDRTRMEFPMLIGRTAIRRRFWVNPARSFIQTGDALD